MSTQFVPYFSKEINEWINAPNIDEAYNMVMQADADHLDFYITDYNTQVRLDSTFTKQHCSIVVRKAIYYRMRELKLMALEQQEQEKQQQAVFDPFMAIVRLVASASIGSFIGSQLAIRTRGAADLDEVNRILGK